jgi:diacylglycerol kinase (ATP)
MQVSEKGSPREAVLVVNAKSRRGREWFVTAREALKDGGIHLREAWAFRDPKALRPKVLEARDQGTELIIVGGGDGTLSSIALDLAETSTTLGVLPFGTGNAFARDLAIPVDPLEAVRTIIAGETAQVDVGTVEDSGFVNVVTVGLSTRIAEQLTGEAKRRFGRMVYLIAVCRALARIRPFEVTIVAGDKEETFETLQVVIGCGRFHAGPFPLMPEASLTDGKLSLYALETTSRISLLRYACNMPGGRHCELHEVTSHSITGGSISARPPQRATVDGEIRQMTPFRFGIRPQSLRVIVAAGFADLH